MSTRPIHQIGAAALALALSFASATAGAEPPDVETHLGVTQVSEGEVVALELRLRGDAASAQPDLAPLAKDFEVLDVQRGRRTSIVNGVRDESVDYVIELVPRRAGDLVVPALPLGAAASDAVALQVAPRPAAAPPATAQRDDASGAAGDVEAADAATDEPVILEARVDRSKPYEQERVVLTVSLYAAGDVLEGALGEPEVPGAIVQKLGDDRRIEKEIDGRRYRGIARTYTLVPETPGRVVVPAIPFEGRVRVAAPARRPRPRVSPFGDPFFDDFFSRAFADDAVAGFFGAASRVVRASSAPLELTVRERPEGVAGQWWLPAREVTLQESWEPASGPVHVGEPVVRKIETRAKGVSPAQIPALPAPEVAGAKQYAEAPKTTETADGSVRVDQTTWIATRPGPLVLPAVEIAWWDTRTNEARTAVLPARSVEVLPALATGDAAGPGASKDARAAGAPSTAQPTLEGAATALASDVARDDARALTRLAAAGCAIALAAFCLGLALARRRPAGRSAAPSPRAAERALRAACRADDAAAAEVALRRLVPLRRSGAPEAPGRSVAADASGPLAREIARLQALRYASTPGAWDGAALWAAWREARRTRRSRPAREAAALPPLYPTL